MAARYIIFDGHIPVVFPSTVSQQAVSSGILNRGVAAQPTSSGDCFYDPERGWKCRAYVVDCGWIDAKVDAEILNRHLCN